MVSQIVLFSQNYQGAFPSYLQIILCFRNVQHYQSRSKSTKIIEKIKARTKSFENFFFPYCINELLKLSGEIRSIESSKQFKKTIVDFIMSKENSIYAIHDISGLKLLTRLRLNFSVLNEHKSRRNFKDTVNPMCNCGFEPETTDQYLLRCKLYTDLRLDLLNNI